MCGFPSRFGRNCRGLPIRAERPQHIPRRPLLFPPRRPPSPASTTCYHVSPSPENSDSPRPCGAFTVDVEDYYQVTAFEKQIARQDWGTMESRVVRNTQRLLALLDRHQVRGTFFVLGWVAERFPELVREIHGNGHELGSHSYWHRLVYSQSPEEFRQDLRASRAAIEDITGEALVAYRAPTFSITPRSVWALEILVEEGFQVDSSIVPARHDRYGMPGAPRGIHRIATASGNLWEYPPSVLRVARVSVPIGGGGYFRAYPSLLTSSGLKLRRLAGPLMFYIHPWEIDPDQPRLQAGTWLSRRRHYVGLARTEKKLEALLRTFAFTTVRDVLRMANAKQVAEIRYGNSPVEQRVGA